MAAKFRQTRDNQFFKLIRMKRILFILILGLFSCEKDNLTPSDPTQHFVEFTFVQVVNKPKKAFKNGQEMSSFSFPAQTGDVIRLYDDYMTICSRIKEQIRQDQIEGGMVGQYNPSITQRLNNLTDKQEHKVNITKFDFDE
jgi:hypothetical protein